MDYRPRVALVCYRYGLEVSPTLKNICSYLDENGLGPVDIYVERLHRHEGFKLPGAVIKTLDGGHSLWRRLRGEECEVTKRARFADALKKHIGGYSIVFAAEYQSLDIIARAGFDLSKVVYLSLEGPDQIMFRGYDRDAAARLIGSAGLRVVQSRERGDDLNRYLGSGMKFMYLPVSHRPSAQAEKKSGSALKLIYSGYFAEWACLAEFLDAYGRTGLPGRASLLLQGHALGTGKYLETLKAAAAGMPGVSFDLSYYDDREHSELLAGQDAGLVFYRNLRGTSNFENLLFSSGKVSSYLWSGLAVMTNIDEEETRRPPFLYIEDFNERNITRAAGKLEADRDGYARAAYETARRSYNFDEHFGKITEKVRLLCGPQAGATGGGSGQN